MQKNDSSKSGDSSSSTNSSPIRTQSEVEYYYSAASPNHRSSSSSGGNSSSQNSLTFPPKSSICKSVYLTPTSSSSSNEENYQISTENRLYLTSLILQYDQLMDQYGLYRGYLKDWSNKLDILSQENASLRLANKDLKKRLNIVTEMSVNLQKNRYLSSGFPSLSIVNDFRTLSIEDNGGGAGKSTTAKNDNGVIPSNEAPVTSPTSVFGNINKGLDEKLVQVQPERVSLPKSISIRSSAYLKMNQPNPPAGTNRTAPSTRVGSAPFVPGTKPGVPLPTVPAVDGSKKGGVDDQKKEVNPLELDVYTQGMSKTELCNIWQETGVCPYGYDCQIAQGIRDLRPVISHPRYKTEVCRMVVSGGLCRYGHGSTGLGFLNPDTMVFAADGFETGYHYWQNPLNNWVWVPYEIWNSEKIFVLGHEPNLVIAACAGGTYWYRKIMEDLRLRIQAGENLTPEMCAHSAYDIMHLKIEDPNLPPTVDIYQEFSEILFGGFIDATGDMTRLATERLSSPSLFYVDHGQVYEIFAANRIFNDDEDRNAFYGTIGSGGLAALKILRRCEQHLIREGLPWKNHCLRALTAMRAAVIQDLDTNGVISVVILTRDGFQLEHYDSRVNIAAGNLAVLGAAINQLILDSIEDGSVKIIRYRIKKIKRIITKRKMMNIKKRKIKCRPIKIRAFLKRTVSLGML